MEFYKTLASVIDSSWSTWRKTHEVDWQWVAVHGDVTALCVATSIGSGIEAARVLYHHSPSVQLQPCESARFVYKVSSLAHTAWTCSILVPCLCRHGLVSCAPNTRGKESTAALNVAVHRLPPWLCWRKSGRSINSTLDSWRDKHGGGPQAPFVPCYWYIWLWFSDVRACGMWERDHVRFLAPPPRARVTHECVAHDSGSGEGIGEGLWSERTRMC